MFTESKSKISDRFLFSYIRYAEEAIDICKKETELNCAEREKTEAYF